MTLLINQSAQGSTGLEPRKCNAHEAFRSMYFLRVNSNGDLEEDSKR